MQLLGSFPVQAALLLLFFPIAWAVARARGYRGVEAYALERRPGWLRTLGVTFALAVVAKALAVAVGVRFGVYEVAPAEAEVGSLALGLAGVLATTFFPSVAEDIVTRGFWFRQAPALGRGALFVVATAAIYVLNHVFRLANGPAEWAMLFAFGLAYATALVRTDTLWAAVGLHWGWNAAAFAAPDLFGVQTLRDDLSPWFSAGAHLAMLGAVLVLTPWLRTGEPQRR